MHRFCSHHAATKHNRMMRRPNAVQTCLGSSRRVTGEKSPVFYLFPSRQQPIHFITVPILRDDRFKTIFLQVYTLQFFCPSIVFRIAIITYYLISVALEVSIIQLHKLIRIPHRIKELNKVLLTNNNRSSIIIRMEA